MTAFTVAAAPPEPTGQQILDNIRRLLEPTPIRFSPAVKPGTAIRVLDGDQKIIVCSWDNRDTVTAAVNADGQHRFRIDGSNA